MAQRSAALERRELCAFTCLTRAQMVCIVPGTTSSHQQQGSRENLGHVDCVLTTQTPCSAVPVLSCLDLRPEMLTPGI